MGSLPEENLIIVVTESADGPHLDEGAVWRYLEHMDHLLLDRQHCQDVFVEINSLVVGQIDLI